ncbi:MAG: hypothetical protein K8U57_07405 [Planctomycetes bacterium]|nr:hypothetical protein [Planctomycetota bacterium]
MNKGKVIVVGVALVAVVGYQIWNRTKPQAAAEPLPSPAVPVVEPAKPMTQEERALDAAAQFREGLMGDDLPKFLRLFGVPLTECDQHVQEDLKRPWPEVAEKLAEWHGRVRTRTEEMEQVRKLKPAWARPWKEAGLGPRATDAVRQMPPDDIWVVALCEGSRTDGGLLVRFRGPEMKIVGMCEFKR